MKRFLLGGMAALLALAAITAADKEEGWTTIFDGKSLNGWKTANENTNSFKLVDGAIVAKGNRCHIYYVGDQQPFKDFELKVDVMTEPNSNGGIYVHTKYQETGWPKYGFETQVNNSGGDWKRTGSLYDVVNVREVNAKDGKWWTQHVIVKGNRITVKVDDKVVVDYEEPADKVAGKDFTRKIDQGTIAFQAHDPGSVIHYKNVRVKKL
jgi:hypothetical protein